MNAARQPARTLFAGLGRVPARKQQRRQLARTFACSSARRDDFSGLRDSLLARRLPLTYDYAAPTPTHLLNVALSDFLPKDAPGALPAGAALPSAAENPQPMPPAHHLVYFPPAMRPSELLPDGTDPQQSPGEPFVRRMWAGGSVRFNNHGSPILLDSGRIACLESLRSVDVKGKPGDEKIFVGIERRIGTAQEGEGEEATRQALWSDNEDDFGSRATVIERRNIVFMRARSKEQAEKDMAAAAKKQLKPPGAEEGTPADYTWTLTPDDKLLFRFSALTYNAHAIHLDRGFCRDVEGHRGLVVHGPLSLTGMATLLAQRLASEGKSERIASIDYRNLSPLYVDEPVKFAGRRNGEGKWDVWVETPQGGLAVKGTAKTEIV